MNEGIPLNSKEGMTFVLMGLAFIGVLYVLNRGIPKQTQTGPSGTIGVRG